MAESSVNSDASFIATWYAPRWKALHTENKLLLIIIIIVYPSFAILLQTSSSNGEESLSSTEERICEEKAMMRPRSKSLSFFHSECLGFFGIFRVLGIFRV